MKRVFSKEHRLHLREAALRRKYPNNWAEQCRTKQQGVYDQLPKKVKEKISRSGTRHSEATKQQMSLSHRGMIYTHKKSCLCAFHSIPVTVLEYALQMLLEDAELEFEAQVRFGRYTVDSYVSSRNLVFEADGSWYHQDKEREQKRDNYLIEKGALAVVHLDEHDLEPWREA